jgi:hypothetical protein
MTFFGMALLTAIGTVVLALFAVVTAWYARNAFREQSKEVRAIEQQVKDGREVAKQQAALLKIQSDQLKLQQRQFDEDQASRRRVQAAQVFILIDSADRLQAQATLTAIAHNTSSQPVYDLWVQWRTDDAEFGTPEARPQLLPRAAESFKQIWTVDAGISGTDVSLDFRDAAGLRWRTTGRGILTELCTDISPYLARSHCKFAPQHEGPHSWERNSPAP